MQSTRLILPWLKISFIGPFTLINIFSLNIFLEKEKKVQKYTL